MLTPGRTELRYDGGSGQFVYDWKTPDEAGSCYRVQAIAADGTSTTALFRLR